MGLLGEVVFCRSRMEKGTPQILGGLPCQVRKQGEEPAHGAYWPKRNNGASRSSEAHAHSDTERVKPSLTGRLGKVLRN